MYFQPHCGHVSILKLTLLLCVIICTAVRNDEWHQSQSLVKIGRSIIGLVEFASVISSCNTSW